VIADPGGDSFERFGTSVAGLGDVDGDGLGDFAVGTSAPEWGRAVVYRGDRERLGRAPALILREGNDPRASRRGEPRDLRDFAQSVAGPGDIDGDGFDDLAVGAPGADNGGTFRGSAVLYRGGRRGIDAATAQRLDDPDGGAHDHFGHVVAGR
jgi:hypothetical protein